MDDSRQAWIAKAASALGRHGSWTGRIHIHKLLYLLQACNLAKPPFEFSLYQYGPYSYDLDEAIAQMELYGYITKTFPQPGYGPKYFVTELGLAEGAKLAEPDATAIDRVAAELGNQRGNDLELIATCIWVETEEGVNDPSDIQRRVKEVKPKYDEGEIREKFEASKRLRISLLMTT